MILKTNYNIGETVYMIHRNPEPCPACNKKPDYSSARWKAYDYALKITSIYTRVNEAYDVYIGYGLQCVVTKDTFSLVNDDHVYMRHDHAVALADAYNTQNNSVATG